MKSWPDSLKTQANRVIPPTDTFRIQKPVTANCVLERSRLIWLNQDLVLLRCNGKIQLFLVSGEPWGADMSWREFTAEALIMYFLPYDCLLDC